MEFSPRVNAFASKAQADCEPVFKRIEQMKALCTNKVLSAFINNRVDTAHLTGSTGYGYDDRGRDTLERIYADIFGCEDALVRSQFVSGTHALSVALWGVLRPGDVLLSVTGEPYDTLHPVIGLYGQGGTSSLAAFGVEYRELARDKEGGVDVSACEEAAVGAKVALISRSRGYTLFQSLSLGDIERAIKALKRGNPGIIVLVDNCYGELVCDREPTQVGADLVAGSLIKNLGGGIARTGGYIVGRRDLVELCAERLTSPCVGKEVGASLESQRDMYLGLFLAPNVVGEALKAAVFASRLFELMGCEPHPRYDDDRADIITALRMRDRDELIAFCRGIQAGSPIDSYVTPEPWAMPGYDSEVIMAAGAFTNGASIEISADAPLREPYCVFLQGGLTYHSAQLAIMSAAEHVSRLRYPDPGPEDEAPCAP